jgi:hypothetical protein
MPPRRVASLVSTAFVDTAIPLHASEPPQETASDILRAETRASAAAATEPHDVATEIARMMQHSSQEAHRAIRDHRKNVAAVERRRRRARREAELLPSSVLLDIVKSRGPAAETVADGCIGTLQRIHDKETRAVPKKRMRGKGAARFCLAPSPSTTAAPGRPRMLCDDGQPANETEQSHRNIPSPTLSCLADGAGVDLDSLDSDGASVATHNFSDVELWGAFCDTGVMDDDSPEPESEAVGPYSPSSPCAGAAAL